MKLIYTILTYFMMSSSIVMRKGGWFGARRETVFKLLWGRWRISSGVRRYCRARIGWDGAIEPPDGTVERETDELEQIELPDGTVE